MSDIMRPMSIGHLMNWALSEYKKKGSIFGIDKLVHYTSGQVLPMRKRLNLHSDQQQVQIHS